MASFGVRTGPGGAPGGGTGGPAPPGGLPGPVAAAVTIGSAIVQGISSYMAADKAADAMADAAKLASDTELEMFYQGREDLAPWRKAGTGALNVLAEKIDAGPGEFRPGEDPGYEFGYKEMVEKPLLRGQAKGGRIGGGRSQKELTRYASDYASSKYDDFLNRWYKSLTPLQSMAGQGQTVSTQGAQMGSNVARGVGQNILAAGDARASGYQQTGTAVSQAAAGLGQNVLDYYYMDKYLK